MSRSTQEEGPHQVLYAALLQQERSFQECVAPSSYGKKVETNVKHRPATRTEEWMHVRQNPAEKFQYFEVDIAFSNDRQWLIQFVDFANTPPVCEISEIVFGPTQPSMVEWVRMGSEEQMEWTTISNPYFTSRPGSYHTCGQKFNSPETSELGVLAKGIPFGEFCNRCHDLMTTQCPGRSKRKVHIKFFTPHYCNKSGRFKSGFTNHFLPNASIPESIWTRSSGLPRSNSQLSIYVAYFRRSQQSFDEARCKCPGNETPTTDPIYYGSSASDQNFANPGPEADHPAVSVPVTTNEKSDEDAIPDFDDSEREDQFTSYIFAPDDPNGSTILTSEEVDQQASFNFAPDSLTTSTTPTSGGPEAHLRSGEKFEEKIYWCEICDMWKRRDLIEEHQRSMKHKRNARRIPRQTREPEVPVSSSVQWRGPVQVFTAAAVLSIAYFLATPAVVSIQVDGEFLLEQAHAQAVLAERPTGKSKFSVLEIPVGSP